MGNSQPSSPRKKKYPSPRNESRSVVTILSVDKPHTDDAYIINTVELITFYSTIKLDVYCVYVITHDYYKEGGLLMDAKESKKKTKTMSFFKPTLYKYYGCTIYESGYQGYYIFVGTIGLKPNYEDEYNITYFKTPVKCYLRNEDYEESNIYVICEAVIK